MGKHTEYPAAVAYSWNNKQKSAKTFIENIVASAIASEINPETQVKTVIGPLAKIHHSHVLWYILFLFTFSILRHKFVLCAVLLLSASDLWPLAASSFTGEETN